MTTRISTGLIALAAVLCYAGSAAAIAIVGDSLHGASGDLAIIDNGSDYTVIWSIDTTGFDDADAIATGHEYLTDVAFKISGMTGVSLVDATVGTLYYPTNINQGTDGCDTDGSSAGFACVSLDPVILATVDQVFSVAFTVEGDLHLSEAVSFRGKYGEGRGWIISENAIPEPSAALVFGIGAIILGRRSTRR